MQTFRTFFKIAKKQLLSCIIYFIIFLAIMFLMSFAAEDSNDKQYKAYSLTISVIDLDHSKASQSLTDYLDSMHELVPMENNGEMIQDSLFYYKVNYVLTIPEGFEKALLNGETSDLVESSKRLDSATGFFLDEQIHQYLKSLRIYLSGGCSVEEASKKTLESVKDCNQVTRLSFEKENSDSNVMMSYYFQYMPYILIAVLILGLSPILITFRRKDLGNRLDCSALHRMDKTLQLSLGCVIYSLVMWLLFIVIGRIIFGSAMFEKDGLLCILNSFVFLLVCVAIALLVSTFSPNKNMLNMITNVVALGMSFFCGIFVPQWLLGKRILAIARFLPAYWYIQVTNRISGFSDEAFSMNLYWKCIGIQLLFFAAIFAVYLVADQQKKIRRFS